MGHLEAFLYGLVQGLTEYLPVSSSAHLVLLPHILKQEDPGLVFDVILHLGTLLATILYFFNEWIAILKTPFPKPDAQGHIPHLSWMHMIVGTMPAVVIGLILNHWIAAHTHSLAVLWVTMPLFGVILWLVDKNRPTTRTIHDATLKDMFIIGCAQSLALIPGVSRSGSTITATRYLGFNRADSARVSFLLSMPVTLGAIVYEGRHYHELIESFNGATPLVIACLTAFVAGAFAIHGLIKFVSRSSYTVFAVYRVLFGIVGALTLGITD
jgi:undecaprenyl-diphosphatase